MKLTLRKSLIFLAVITVLTVVFAFGAAASELTYPASGWVQMYGEDGETAFEGTEGTDLKWTVDQVTEGEKTETVLTITGTETTLTFNSGAAWDKMGADTVPWYAYKDAVTKVVIEAPITNIVQPCAFNQLYNVHTFILPDNAITLKTKLSMAFANMWELTTFGPEGTPENTIDLRNLKGSTSQGLESCAKGKTITVLMPYFSSSPIISTKNFASDTKVTFKVVEGSECETYVKSLQEVTSGNYVQGANVNIEYYDLTEIASPTGQESDGHAAWSLNVETGALEIKQAEGAAGWIQFDTNDANWQLFKSVWGSKVKTATVAYFQKLSFSSSSSGGISPLFAGMTNLETVTFAADQRMQNTSADSIGWFEGCTALKSVTFGGELADGVADLSGANINTDDSASIWLANMFKNCGKITKVILPESEALTTIQASTFAGCTNLESVVIGSNITAIEDGAFAACPDVVLTVDEESYAEEWATANNITVDVQTVIITGKFAEKNDLTYSYNPNTKVLTISGTATVLEMDYAISYNGKATENDKVVAQLPWIEHGIQKDVEEVIIEAPITTVKNYMLSQLTNCKKMTIPATLTDISGSGSFSYNHALDTVVIAGNEAVEGIIDFTNITKFGGYTIDDSFQNCTPTILLGENLESFGVQKIAQKCKGLTFKIYEGTAIDDFVTMYLAGGYAENKNICQNITFKYYPKSPVAFDGYSVRVNNYNGLRGVFSVAQADIDANSAASGMDLNVSGTDYVTAGEKIVKSAVYKNGIIVNKILKTSSDDKTDFAISLVKLPEASYKTDIVMRGYAVVKNAKGGIEFYYTDTEEASLYDITLGMYMDGVLTEESGNIALDALSAGVVTLTAGTDYAIVEGQTDLEGNAIGDTFTFSNVPVVTQTDVDSVLTFTASDVKVTLYEYNDEYVAVYTGTGAIPKSERWGGPRTVNQLSAGFATKYDKASWETVSSAVPNPVLNSDVEGKIKTVIIKEGITELGDELFNQMRSLKTVVLPKSLTKAAKAVFQSCGVDTVYEIGATPVAGLIDVSCIEELTTAYMVNGNESVKQIRLPENVTVLGKQAFQNASALVSVACGDTAFVQGVADFSNTAITDVLEQAFNGASLITTVNLPETATNIHENSGLPAAE